MSFGWSVGDILSAAKVAWTVYQSVAPGPNNAKSDYARFKSEFHEIQKVLQQLESVAPTNTENAPWLGEGYKQTIGECEQFVRKHERLTSNVSPGTKTSFRRLSFSKIATVWDQVSWPLESNDAEKLRKSLERYVQIATLRVATQDREESKLEHLEILRAVKGLTAGVTMLLRRCAPDGVDDSQMIDYQYLAQLQHRTSQPFLLRAIPEHGEWSQFNNIPSENSLDRIYRLHAMIENMLMREQIQPVTRVNTIDTVGSGGEMVAPVVGFLRQISDDAREALGHLGVEGLTVLQRSPTSLKEGLNETGALNSEARYWDDLAGWLNFQMMHFDGNNSRHIPSHRPSSRSRPSTPVSALSLPSPTTSSTVESPLASPAPRRMQGVPMARASSTDSQQPYSSSWSSCGSVSEGQDRVRDAGGEPLTQQAVRILFPDPNRAGYSLHPPMTCTVLAIFNSHTHVAESIEAVDIHGKMKITHTIQRQGLKASDGFLVPYVENIHIERGEYKRYRLRFQGSHKVKIEGHGKIKRFPISPIYVCENRDDFRSFQNILLGRNVILCVDVSRICVDGGEDHCSLETVRLLEDPTSKVRSLLYYASNRGHHRGPGFLEWGVSDSNEPKKSGKKAIKLHFRRNESMRRESTGSSITSASHDSHRTQHSSTHPIKVIKTLELVFHDEYECDEFLKALKSCPSSSSE